jgi:hypothetical protein
VGEEKEELLDAAIDDEMKEERIEKNIGFAYEACYSTDAGDRSFLLCLEISLLVYPKKVNVYYYSLLKIFQGCVSTALCMLSAVTKPKRKRCFDRHWTMLQQSVCG